MTRRYGPVSARDRIDKLFTPGNASKFIGNALTELPRGTRVVLCLRVSGRAQKHNANLSGQDSRMRQALQKIGIVVLKSFKHVGPGWDASWLIMAADYAKRHNAVLVAESTDRFRRHLHFNTKSDRALQPTEADLEDLRYWTDGVPLFTVLPPNASPDEVRSYQTKRGQETKNRKGGRRASQTPGYKKRRRHRLLPSVLEMREKGASISEISNATSIPRTTVASWINASG